MRDHVSSTWKLKLLVLHQVTLGCAFDPLASLKLASGIEGSDSHFVNCRVIHPRRGIAGSQPQPISQLRPKADMKWKDPNFFDVSPLMFLLTQTVRPCGSQPPVNRIMPATLGGLTPRNLHHPTGHISIILPLITKLPVGLPPC